MSTWNSYHQWVGEQPNSIVVGCLNEFVTRREAGLDLGAGNLRDSKFLLSQGFTKVVAVDSSEESLAYATEGVELHIALIETFVPERDAFDFAFSCNTLFFLTPEQVTDVFRNVFAGLRSGGVFACNVLGDEDDWVKQGKAGSHFTPETLQSLFADFLVIGSNEMRRQSQSLDNLGMLVGKYWHTHSLAVQKL